MNDRKKKNAAIKVQASYPSRVGNMDFILKRASELREQTGKRKQVDSTRIQREERKR